MLILKFKVQKSSYVRDNMIHFTTFFIHKINKYFWLFIIHCDRVTFGCYERVINKLLHY